MCNLWFRTVCAIEFILLFASVVKVTIVYSIYALGDMRRVKILDGQSMASVLSQLMKKTVINFWAHG